MAVTDLGIKRRWLTWGLEIKKKSQGRARPMNMLMLQAPLEAGTVSSPGVAASSLPKKAPKPPRAATITPSTAAEVTIIIRAWKASVQATERSPAILDQAMAQTTATIIPATTGMAPPLMPFIR